MTKHIFLFAAIATMVSCSNEPKGSSNTDDQKNDSTTAEAQAKINRYGDTISTDGAMDMAAFAAATADKDSLPATLNCEIITSCTKKGCWMDVKMADGTPMKVTFKDYGFFVPTAGLEGKKAVVKGYAVKEVTDVATLRHYAEDAGKSKEECEKITEAESNWSFVADGVVITD